MFRKAIILAALASLSACAAAITKDELTANSWMPKTGSVASCELPSTITFKKDGTLVGEPGCNNLFGNYSITSDGKVTFSSMGMTRKLCAKEYMDQEDQFMAMINQIQYIKKDGTYLVLLNKDKKEIGRLEPEKSGACQ